MKVTTLNRRLECLETAAKPALQSSWPLMNLSHEEVAAKLTQYKVWFSDPDWDRELGDLPWLSYFEPVAPAPDARQLPRLGSLPVRAPTTTTRA